MGEHSGRAWRVGLVEDHPLFATGLRRLVTDTDDLIWSGFGGDVDTLLRGSPNVDVVVLDLRLADDSAPYDNVQCLHRFGKRVLIFTSGEHPDLLRSAAGAGALGFVLKTDDERVVLEAIRSVARGESVVSREWAAAVDGDVPFGAVHLSEQLRRVLTQYASGRSAPAIAAELNISAETVRDYLVRIRLKYAEAGRPTRTKIDFSDRAIEDGLKPSPRLRRSRR